MKSPNACQNSTRNESDDSCLNLTGSPLKDDTEIVDMLSKSIAVKTAVSKPWPDIEESYAPIDISLAREIVIKLLSQKFPNGSHGWIFILCTDRSDNDDSMFLLSSYISPHHIRNGFGKYHGLLKHEDIAIGKLYKRHYSMISAGSKLDSQLESLFEIKPEMSLKFINKVPGEIPSLSHMNIAPEVVLYQRVRIGKNHVLCDRFWTQIKHLNMIKAEIVGFKNSSLDGTFGEPTYNYGMTDGTFENLCHSINGILNEVNPLDEGDVAADSSLEGVLKRTQTRPLLEVTDQLWDLLKHTNSYGDLKKIITYIFQAASRSNIVNIPSSQRQNRFGELIRELCLQRLAVPHLVSTEPLELLLEVGIEKLMKDFEFILSESKICKLSEMTIGGGAQLKGDACLNVRKSLSASVDLPSSDKMRKTLLKNGSRDNGEEEEIGIRNSRFVEREAEANIAKLARIHLSIEHLLLIQNNLSSQADYYTLAKRLLEKPLMPLEELQNQTYDLFEFQLDDKKVN